MILFSINYMKFKPMYDDAAHISDKKMAKSESTVGVQSFTNSDKFVVYE